jgi:hypothetical protein
MFHMSMPLGVVHLPLGSSRSGGDGPGRSARDRAASAGKGARASAHQLVEAVGALVEQAIGRMLLSDERVTSAAEANRLLSGDADTEALTDNIQRVVLLAVPVIRRVARGARFTRVPWVMVASSAVSITVAVRTGVRELQLLASLVAHRIESAAGAPPDRVLVTKLAIDLYLDPNRAPDLADDRLRLVALTRTWVMRGALGRTTSKRAAAAFAAAERLDAAAVSGDWAATRRSPGEAQTRGELHPGAE